MAPDPRGGDVWEGLRSFTTARIATGRSGGSLPTRELLRFGLDHARAVDAVFAELDLAAMGQELEGRGFESIAVHSQAPDRITFLLRPDLGRRLRQDAHHQLLAAGHAADRPDVVFILTDGLSALAVFRHALPLLEVLIPKLRKAGLQCAPIVLVQQGRVAIQDEIGSLLNARLAVSLIGERPGLGAPDSLGAYLVHGPAIGNTDARRNCVSNIRPEGLPYGAAGETLGFLITEALRLGLSGVALKDSRSLSVGGAPSALID